METLYFLARLCTCGLWAATGVYSVFHYQGTVLKMTQMGVPWPRVMLVPVLIMKFAGSLMLLTNHFVWATALAWIGFLILVTFLFHFTFYDEQRKFIFPEMIQFSKNVSLIGGLLTLIVLDPDKPHWLLALLQ